MRSRRSVWSRSRLWLIWAQAAVAVAQAGLGGQEDPVADVRHPWSQAQLGVAVAGRDVEVVDPGVQGQLDGGVGGGLVDLGQGGRAVDQDRALMA